jgi:hypothetical protein
MAATIVDPVHSTTPAATDTLEAWVMGYCDQWRDNYRTNYAKKHDEYYRLFRGIWAAEDRTRETERSRIISPALQQAVESNVAEIEEATFGRGVWFDITDDQEDADNADVVKLRKMMHEDFSKLKTKQRVAECILNAAIFGTGIGELVLDTITETVPATQPIEGQGLNAVGVMDQERTITKLIPVMPRNFLCDSAAEGIEPDQAMGCAVDKDVPTFAIEQLQEKGIYRNVGLSSHVTDTERMADPELSAPTKGQTRLTKYFGLVPRELLKAASEEDEDDVVDLGFDDEEEPSSMVEAIVIIADGTTLLKAEANPNMMGDRNIVAFQWDKVPSRFQGRGVCEKGYNSQKALDAEMRARIDALGLTVHPMMGMDASRMPRGARPTVAPGKIILTNGDPREVLHPFTFGQVGQITFPQAQALNSMVQQATGAVDMTPTTLPGDTGAATMSMSTGAIVKRHKRTQLNFEESFLIPFITKVAWRYMQYEPERFPAKDYKFVVKGNLGIVAREYEVAQLGQLLQTLGDDSPLKPALMEAVINHLNISNREEVIALLKQSSEVSPEQQQKQQAVEEAQMRFQNSQSAALEGQAAESTERANKYKAETLAVPVQLEIDQIKAIAATLPPDATKEAFERRLAVTDRMLTEKKLSIDSMRALSSSKPKEKSNNE